MLVMLCQSILDMSDEEIVEDYHKSDGMRASPVAKVMKPQRKGKLDRNVFAGSPREACVGALDFIRTKYGTVSPGYLDSIGFDLSWRQRFQLATQEKRSLQSKL